MTSETEGPQFPPESFDEGECRFCGDYDGKHDLDCFNMPKLGPDRMFFKLNSVQKHIYNGGKIKFKEPEMEASVTNIENASKAIAMVKRLIGILPVGVGEALEKLLNMYLMAKPFLGFISDRHRGMIANVAGHGVLTPLKKVNWDTMEVRTFLQHLLIALFDLNESWLPKWPLDPNEAVPATD